MSVIVVVTPAPSLDLVALARVKRELDISGVAEDAALRSWIRAASNYIENVSNRVFASATLLQTFRLKSRQCELILCRCPVTAIASVVEDGVTLDATDYEINADSGVLVRLRDGHPSYWSAATIAVTFTSGWTQQDIPEAIQRAAVLLVKQYRLGADRDPFIQTENNVGVGTVTYGTAGSVEIDALIAPYRIPCAG